MVARLRGGGTERGQQRGQHPRSGVHLRAILTFGFRERLGCALGDRTWRHPHRPTLGFFVRPLRDVPVEGTNTEDRRMHLLAGLPIEGDGETFTPREGDFLAQVQVGLVGIDFENPDPEEPHQPVGEAR